jgi:dTDP-4-amino-4,6-dideoxygalactose transaminase
MLSTQNIPFNKPAIVGNEKSFIEEVIDSRALSGDGVFTQKCQQFFEQRYGFKKCLLTTSCTDALEMAALLLNITSNDEVIMPAYTFVSTANAFVLRGAKIVFADSSPNHPDMDENQIEQLITTKTKAIVVMHYAGVACNMDAIMELANKHGIAVIEDAALGLDAHYHQKPLGSIGHLATFSFHETKNITCGEGGLLVINDDRFVTRADIIREKGTNRAAYFRGEVDKYGWVDLGSSFLPAEHTAAFLYAQLLQLDAVQQKRKQLWNSYYQKLEVLAHSGKFKLPTVPNYAKHNASVFYILCSDVDQRELLIKFLKERGVATAFHYLSLHSSVFYATKHDGRVLTNSDRYSETLLRLPLYFDLQEEEIDFICSQIHDFFQQ